VGIKPAATMDEILKDRNEDIDFNAGSNIEDTKECKNSDNLEEEEDSECNVMLKQAVVALCHKKRSSILQGSAGKASHKTPQKGRHAGKGIDSIDGFNALMLWQVVDTTIILVIRSTALCISWRAGRVHVMQWDVPSKLHMHAQTLNSFWIEKRRTSTTVPA
jgi:hypothetical protein